MTEYSTVVKREEAKGSWTLENQAGGSGAKLMGVLKKENANDAKSRDSDLLTEG